MVNKVILIGNLGRDPEVRSTPSGQPVASFTWPPAGAGGTRTATARSRPSGTTSSSGASRRRSPASISPRASRSIVEGRLQTRSWDDRQTGEKKYKTESSATTSRCSARAAAAANSRARAAASSRAATPRPRPPAPPMTRGVTAAAASRKKTTSPSETAVPGDRGGQPRRGPAHLLDDSCQGFVKEGRLDLSGEPKCRSRSAPFSFCFSSSWPLRPSRRSAAGAFSVPTAGRSPRWRWIPWIPGSSMPPPRRAKGCSRAATAARPGAPPARGCPRSPATTSSAWRSIRAAPRSSTRVP